MKRKRMERLKSSFVFSSIRITGTWEQISSFSSSSRSKNLFPLVRAKVWLVCWVFFVFKETDINLNSSVFMKSNFHNIRLVCKNNNRINPSTLFTQISICRFRKKLGINLDLKQPRFRNIHIWSCTVLWIAYVC